MAENRIGIVGGTFDPFHRGHIEPQRALIGQMGWSKLLYVPAFRQPFKKDVKASTVWDRVAMTVLGIEDEPLAEISYVEVERGGVSYTIDTLTELRRQRPGTVMDWIIGDDNLEALTAWRSIEEILEKANFVVLTRTGSEKVPPSLQHRTTRERSSPAGSIILVENDAVPISSTAIRQRVQNGLPIAELVHSGVARYIQHYGLYQ